MALFHRVHGASRTGWPEYPFRSTGISHCGRAGDPEREKINVMTRPFDLGKGAVILKSHSGRLQCLRLRRYPNRRSLMRATLSNWLGEIHARSSLTWKRLAGLRTCDKPVILGHTAGKLMRSTSWLMWSAVLGNQE